MAYYINYRYKNLIYDEKLIIGHFSVLPCDGDVECDFLYDMEAETFEIWNNNKPKEDIMPIPIYWLLNRLKRNGFLNENEYHICF